jgi:hypothetical protein
MVRRMCPVLRVLLAATLLTVAAGSSVVHAGAQHGVRGTSAPGSKAQHQVPMLFSDGFETGALNNWAGGRNVVIQRGISRSGRWAAHFASSNKSAYARTFLAHPYASIFFRASVHMNGHSKKDPISILALIAASRKILVSVMVNPNGALGWHNGATGQSANSQVRLPLHSWHQIQVHLTMSAQASSVALWLDGRLIPSLSATAPLRAKSLTSQGARAVKHVGPKGKGHRSTVFRPSILEGNHNVAGIELGEPRDRHSFDFAIDNVTVAAGYIPASQPAPSKFAEIKVQTVPPAAGVHFHLYHHLYKTDSHGAVRLFTPVLNPDPRPHIIVGTSVVKPGVRAALGRWYWYGPEVGRAALNVYNLVHMRFTKANGKPIDPHLITKVVIKASHGVVTTYKGREIERPHWVQSSRVVPTQGGLLNKALYYTIRAVQIHGSNVINVGQQKYFPLYKQKWDIHTLFYPAHISVHDGIFHFPIGSKVRLVYPDGYVQTAELGAGASRTIIVPRGAYKISILGAGLATVSPLTMTRPQVLEIEFISYLDIVFVLLILAALGLGTLFIGRPHIFYAVRGFINHPRRQRAARANVGNDLLDEADPSVRLPEAEAAASPAVGRKDVSA